MTPYNLTLEQWASGWPYRLTRHQNGNVSIPDSTIDEEYRAHAWHLLDYRVSSVNGGSIWFVKRRSDNGEPKGEQS